MGWYDAYKPTHVNRVNVLPMTSNSGSAAKNFGDAFTKIGDSMLKVDKAREDEKLNNTRNDLLTTQNLQNKKLLNAFDTTNALKNDALRANIDNTKTGTSLTKKKVNVFDTTNALKNDALRANIDNTKTGTSLTKKKVNVFDENNQADLNAKNATTAYKKKETESYDKLLDSKISENNKDDFTQQKTLVSFAKAVADKKLDKNGFPLYDPAQIQYVATQAQELVKNEGITPLEATKKANDQWAIVKKEKEEKKVKAEKADNAVSSYVDDYLK